MRALKFIHVSKDSMCDGFHATNLRAPIQVKYGQHGGYWWRCAYWCLAIRNNHDNASMSVRIISIPQRHVHAYAQLNLIAYISQTHTGVNTTASVRKTNTRLFRHHHSWCEALTPLPDAARLGCVPTSHPNKHSNSNLLSAGCRSWRAFFIPLASYRLTSAAPLAIEIAVYIPILAGQAKAQQSLKPLGSFKNILNNLSAKAKIFYCLQITHMKRTFMLHIDNWTPVNIFQWNLKWNTKRFIQENVFENAVWKRVAILSGPQCVNIAKTSHIEQRYTSNVHINALQWRYNEHDGVSNHQSCHYCDWLLNRLSRLRWKKTSKLRVTFLCEGNSPVTSEFPAQSAGNAENVSVWWRHHGIRGSPLHLQMHRHLPATRTVLTKKLNIVSK